MASNNIEYYEKLKQLQEKQHSRLVNTVLTEQRSHSFCRLIALFSMLHYSYTLL